MTNMTGKISLLKRLNFANSEFFLANNFITNYLRQRRSFEKLKNLSETSAANNQQAPNGDQEQKQVAPNSEPNEDEYEDCGDEHDAETDSKPRSCKSKYKKLSKKSTHNSKAKSCGANNSKSTQFVLHNKPPIWNETSQVYQLDFGGRVTQESAKNFQIEYAGKQVMQFGRIDSNAYTLDFEWPFTTVQAFSIALANITQRLK